MNRRHTHILWPHKILLDFLLSTILGTQNPIEFLTVHNIIQVQMLSQIMHKIYRTFAPTYTREVFTSHSPPISHHNNIDQDLRLPTGLDATNILNLSKKYLYLDSHLNLLFSSCIKRQILSEQSSGNPITWEKLNIPLYSISTSSVTLRSCYWTNPRMSMSTPWCRQLTYFRKHIDE